MEEPAGADPRSIPPRPFPRWTIFAILALVACAPSPADDTLARVRRTRILTYGCDMEGGGPYAYPDPNAPRDVTGFEVELMRRLADGLGAAPEFKQGQWDQLLNVLDGRGVDLVVNGYEWTDLRARAHLATRPYYIYQLQVMAGRDGQIRAWDDLLRPASGGRRWRVGVLGGSAGDTFAQGHPSLSVVSFTGAADAMQAVVNGQVDATLQDLPAARFYAPQYPGLALAGPPVGRGDYVIYVRQGDEPLRDALDRGLGQLIASGELRKLYEKYGIWTDAQEALATGDRTATDAPASRESARGWAVVRKYGPLLLESAGMTVLLSVSSMPLAIGLGLLVALGRLYGPRPLRWALAVYVELLRGTPLMLQLFVLFYLLRLPALVAGIGGLAINYSAYEAEIYRAGLQAIPAGQMEAALALGMSRGLALRRVILPQALRIVLPPVTNDFIALFKDTSVCSVITLVELSKQYQILANGTGGVAEFALATAALYLAMSLPLSWFSRWSERHLAGDPSAQLGGPRP